MDATVVEAVFPCVLEKHSAFYVSTPITSGKRFVEWRSATGLKEVDAEYVDEHRRQVIEVNRAEIRPLVRSLRRRLLDPVIDPTALDDVPGWTQHDYRHLWGRVIERYVKTAVFTYGWEYSSGCGYEFLIAKKVGVNTVDSKLNGISVAGGLALLATAIDDYRQAGIPVEFLESIQQQLSALLDGKG